jgi:hypothetical protein
MMADMPHEKQPMPGSKSGYPRSTHQKELESHHAAHREGGDGLRRGTNPGYSTEAHTTGHHGPEGEAIGKPGSQVMPHYDTPTQQETGKRRMGAGEGPTFVEGHGHDHHPAKAHHHPRAGEAHNFKGIGTAGHNAHGYGHALTQRAGPLRLSGHGKADRLGSRKK